MQRSYIPAIAVFIIVLTAAFTVSGANSRLADRGDYIVNRVAMCADCHTPALSNGKHDPKRTLAGAPIGVKPLASVPGWVSRAPNLTPAGDLKKWSDAQSVKFLMTGIAPNGRMAGTPMPQYRLNENDAKAVCAYLRCLPPVKGR